MHSHYFLANVAIAGLAAAAPIENVNSISSDELPRILMSQPFYPQLTRYAHFAAASGDSYCSNPPYSTEVEKYIYIASTTTEATLFRADDEQELILAFPGSNEKEDYKLDGEDYPTSYQSSEALYNGDCDGCEVHTGFYKAWTSAAPYTMQVVEQALAEHPTYNLTLAGYSLGGALANLAYASFKSQHKHRVHKAFTYGQPRVGNQEYADFVDSLSGATETEPGELHRVTHAQDGVPQLPGQSAGYQHSRTEYFQKDPEEAYNTFRCHGQEPDDCSKAHGRGYINTAHFHYASVNMIDGSSCTYGNS